MEKKNLICINCPLGCSLEIVKEGEEYKVTGNSCKRGVDYAIAEVTNPVRVLTTSVFVNNGTYPLVSVKTSSGIPKGMMFELMKELSSLRVDAPVRIGDVLVKNIMNTGADIVATRNVDKE